MEGLVTPPFRVGQSNTHIYVEAQCPDAPGSSKAEAVCDDIVFVLKHPPYYLPLHFPAPVREVEQIHQNGSVVRVDLVKAEPGLEFIGLEDIQPTMYANDQQDTGPVTAMRKNDPEAESILKDVLQRENMTAIKDEKTRKSRKDPNDHGLLFASLDSATLQANHSAAEALENDKFDEQAYLDAYVDEYGEVADALAWTYNSSGSSPDSTVRTSDAPQNSSIRLLLLDVLYAYHLALLLSSGPPVYTWLLCSLSRSLSVPAAPPLHDAHSVQSVLRVGYRRGLVFTLYRNWKLCERAAHDVVRRLSAGKADVLVALQEITACLQEGAKEAPEGPDEAERWSLLVDTVAGPLAQKVTSLAEEDVLSLAQGVSATLPNITKSSIGETWDLELLEQMAQDVLAEAGASEQEARAKASIEQVCLDLTPPFALQEGFDAFASPIDDATRADCSRWREEEAPRLLQDLSKQFTRYALRRMWSGSTSTEEDVRLRGRVLIAAARFLDESLPWSNSTTSELARRVISRAGLRPTMDIIRLILRDHLRPLFASPSPGSVNEQGRLRHETANLVPSVRAGLMDDGDAWKGKRAIELQGVHGERNLGAASHAILALCMGGLHGVDAQSDTQEISPWEALWPLLLPPLMTLVQDSDPLWRYRGTRVLVEQLLSPRPRQNGSQDRWGAQKLLGAPLPLVAEHGSAIEMLQRANLVPLLQETLYNSLTYLSHSHGTLLLDQSLHGLMQLANVLPAESRERAEETMKILQDGILRTWTFMPRSMSVDDDGVRPDGLDLLAVTFGHLSVLAQRLGPLAARFLDVTLEFLSSQVNGLYDALVVDGARCSSRLGVKVRRVDEALRATSAIVNACTMDDGHEWLPAHPPSLRQWVTPCLIATSKAWLALCDRGIVDAQIESKEVAICVDDPETVTSVRRLIAQLRQSWSLWRRLFPQESTAIYATVSKRESSIACIA